MRAVYVGNLTYATQLLAGFEKEGCETRVFRKFFTTILAKLPKKELSTELDCEFEPPKFFSDHFRERGLDCPMLHIRMPRRNNWGQEKVVMWLGGLPILLHREIIDSDFKKIVRSLAEFVVSTRGGIEVRIPTPDEQREYDTPCSLIVKAVHPAFHLNPLPDFTISSFRVSKEYSAIYTERQLDVSFGANTPERIREGGNERAIRIAERGERGLGYDLALVLLKGCPEADVFYRSYNGSREWQRLSDNGKVLT